MKRTILAAGLALIAMCGTASAGCNFKWTHYGANQTYKLIDPKIGSKVPDAFCERLAKTHEIVIISDAFHSPTRTLAHVVVGLRKRGTNDVPKTRSTAYKFEDGNFVVGKSYDMAASLALDTVMDVMSDMDTHAN